MLKNNQNGLTLMEIMVVVAITVTVIAIGSEFLVQGIKMKILGQEQDESVYNARQVLNEIGQEIRDDEILPYIVESLVRNFNELKEKICDIDNDSVTEKVRYFLDNTNNILVKGIIEPSGSPLQYLSTNESTSTIAKYINNQSEAAFTYFDENGNEITNPSTNKHDIRLIHIFLKIDVNPDNTPPAYNLISDVQIRNLKNNL